MGKSRTTAASAQVLPLLQGVCPRQGPAELRPVLRVPPREAQAGMPHLQRLPARSSEGLLPALPRLPAREDEEGLRPLLRLPARGRVADVPPMQRGALGARQVTASGGLFRRRRAAPARAPPRE
eukprot:CAMPEP_0175291592 /NCGR_PEP_ID=MMETSP0093-20121207/56487_1 /TAXON_ID=311494 /ORGANISM="Alexandrium monilatum, Strain CCMP3105" /LENGTH=123 /DNA_ID=CAMNT_0016587351 /DNA_START=94 /DNA_END=462 /DNA_ORIENTATION=+